MGSVAPGSVPSPERPGAAPGKAARSVWPPAKRVCRPLALSLDRLTGQNIPLRASDAS